MLPALLLVAALISLRSYYTDPQYSKTRGWRALAGEIRRLTGGLPAEQVRVVQNYPDPTLWYYYTGPADHLVLPPAAQDAAGAGREVAGLAERGLAWVIMPVYASDAWDPSGLASSALAQGFTLVDRRQVGVWPLEIYVRPDPAALQPLNTTFANGVTLRGAAVEPATAEPEDWSSCIWPGPARPAPCGARRRSSSTWPARPAGRLPRRTSRWGEPERQGITSYPIPLPADAAGGQYQVVAGIYDPGRPGAPRINQTDGRDHVELGSVRNPSRRFRCRRPTTGCCPMTSRDTTSERVRSPISGTPRTRGDQLSTMAYSAKGQKNRAVDRVEVGRLPPGTAGFCAARLSSGLRESLWSDGRYQHPTLSQPLGQMLRNMPVEHAPGYFLLLHVWFPLAGTGDFALRFPSLIPSVLTVAIAYRLGADLGSRRAGLAAVLLLATNAFRSGMGKKPACMAGCWPPASAPPGSCGSC